jgi:manganese/zinc/iron transport system substrate-binding protein
VLALCLAGCHEQADGAGSSTQTQQAHRFDGDYPIHIVVTTGMVADLVEHVGGQHVTVTPLMGEGVDPHLYKASSGDVSRLNQADMVVYSGLHLEGRMGDVLARLARRKPAFAVTDGLDHERLLKVGPNQFDPHVWFDVGLWAECLSRVETELVGFDPAHEADYRHEAAAYRQELAELDKWCRDQIASIPIERRVLVTAHDAFHYFGRAYDIEVKAIQGISTQAEAGVSQINGLVDFISQKKIKAVFVETSVSERNIRALIEGCDNQGHHVEIGGQLFSDAMGKLGTPDSTYAGMVRHNVDTIRRALE